MRPPRWEAGAQDLLTAAECSGGIPLGELAQAELCALGGERASLVCKRSTSWWVRLGEDGRRGLGRRALRLLAARGLLRVPDGADVAELYEGGQLTNEHLAAELFLILAARRAPQPVVACHVPGQDSWCHPRFFGITSPDSGLRALVCEVLTDEPAGPPGRPVLGTILRYTLLSPARAAHMITAWAVLTAGASSNGEPPAVTVNARTSGAVLKCEEYRLRPAGGRFTMTCTGPDGRTSPASCLSEAEMKTLLASALTRMAQ